MQGRESSSHAKTREELMYWRSLNPSFKVDLHDNFRSALEIPLYFTENVKGKLPHKVVLKGPSVDLDTWEVQLKTSNDTTWLVGEGWEVFVSAFSLEENDTLVFKYKNNSYFKVRVYNGRTSCEKESSHFVINSVSHQAKESCSQVQKTDGLKQETKSDQMKKRKHDELNSMSKDLMKHSEPNITKKDYAESDSNESLDEPAPIVFGKNVRAKTELEAEYISTLSISCSREKTVKEVLRAKQPLKEESEDSGSLVFGRNVKVKTEPEVDVMSTSCISREKTAKGILRARHRAKEIQLFTDKSFYVVLSRSHVYGTMKLGIPRKWWDEVIKSKCNKCLKLRLKGKNEFAPHLYFCCYDESNSTATITTGWKKFVQENSLYEYDCCVFSLAKPFEENSEVIHLEVEIVRANLGVSQDL